MKSQMGIFNLIIDGAVRTREASCNIAEFISATIIRVVRSTMAAESASLSQALDKQLYLRLVMECLLHGEPDLLGDWRKKLLIPGHLVTDAKSLYDHLTTTGSLPKERQTLVDLLCARDLFEAKVITIKWLPNRHMIADCLTKAVAPNEVYDLFIKENKFSLVPTEDQVKDEAHRLELRQGQRQRARERKNASTMK